MEVMCSEFTNLYSLSSVYKTLGYMEVIAKGAEVSMRAAVDEVQSKPIYSKDGEVHNLYLNFCTDGIHSSG